MSDGGKSEQPSERELAAVRVLAQASSIPLDQEGPVMVPPLGFWAVAIQGICCLFGHHAWGPTWIYRPLVPDDHDVARMLSNGAGWPEYETQICRGCGVMARRRSS